MAYSRARHSTEVGKHLISHALRPQSRRRLPAKFDEIRDVGCGTMPRGAQFISEVCRLLTDLAKVPRDGRIDSNHADPSVAAIEPRNPSYALVREVGARVPHDKLSYSVDSRLLRPQSSGCLPGDLGHHHGGVAR